MTKRTFFIGCIAVILQLGLLGCANEVDDAEDSDTIIRIESITPSPLIPPCAADSTVTVVVGGISRGGAGGSPLNDVILERYSISYSPPLGGTLRGTRAVDINVLVPGDGTGSFVALAVPASFTGPDPSNATVSVEGRDTLGNFASAEGNFGILACQ
jgi:hypothetical protein